MKAHVCAGLDPADFWHLTPREWAVRMDGAADRVDALRCMMAVSAWVGAQTDKAGLERFLAGGNPEPLPPEALERTLMSVSAGMREISMEHYLSRRKIN